MQQGDYFTTRNAPITKRFAIADAAQQSSPDLREWLDDFINSDEFAQFFSKKFANKETMYDVKDIQPMEDVPEASQHKETAKELYDRLQRALLKRQIRNTVRNQKKGIEIIRNKMKEFKDNYLHNAELRHQLWLEERIEVLNFVKEKYNLSIDEYEKRPELVEMVLKEEKRKKERCKRLSIRRRAILVKLLKEMKREKQMKAEAAKTYDLKMKDSTRRVKGLKIVGHTMPMQDRMHLGQGGGGGGDQYIAPSNHSMPEDLARRLVEHSIPDRGSATRAISNRTLPKRRRSLSSKSSLPSRKSNRSRNSKNSKTGLPSYLSKLSSPNSSSSKTTSSTWQSRRSTKPRTKELFNIPRPFITNARFKLKPTLFLNDMRVLLKEFENLSGYLKDREEFELERLLEDSPGYSFDRDIRINPEKVMFKDFECGRTYRKRIVVMNKSLNTKKVRFDRLVWNADINDNLLLEIEPVGAHKLIAGMEFSIRLRFNPETLRRTTTAKLIFLTYRVGQDQYKQISVDVVCTPYCADIQISPLMMTFSPTPIWRARKSFKLQTNYKTLTIKNLGMKACTLTIKRMFTPMAVSNAWRNIEPRKQSDSILLHQPTDEKITGSGLYQVTDLIDFPRNLVQECVENVFNVFQFDRYTFKVPGHSTVKVKIFFLGTEYEGYCAETYYLTVYELYGDCQALYDSIGAYELVINAETTGHFLKLNPNMVDFEGCCYDSVYQTHFDVQNTSSVAHLVHVGFPKTMQTYVDASVRNFIVRAHGSFKVGVKFMPRRDIVTSNKFFDAETAMFEFPIYIGVRSKGYDDTPPLVLDAFATVTEPLLLYIKPSSAASISILHGEFLVNMGICSTMETVYYVFELTNKSLVPQYYAFLDLPAFITIHPNYGFGRLMPMQTIELKLYISFHKRDLDSIADDGNQLFHNFLVYVKCTTLKKLGGVKRRINNKQVLNKLKKMEAIVSSPAVDRNTALYADMEDLRKLFQNEMAPEDGTFYSCSGDEPIFQRSLELTNTMLMLPNERIIEMYANSFTQSNTTSTQRLTRTLTLCGEDMTTCTDSEEGEDGSLAWQPHHGGRMTSGFWIQAQLQDMLCDFSHQFIYFPNTPCGCSSIKSVELRARRYIRMQNKRKINSPYRVSFQLFGDSRQIQAEPIIGELVAGESARIYFIAQPEIPRYLVEQKIRAIKRQEAIERRQIFEMFNESPIPDQQNAGGFDKRRYSAALHNARRKSISSIRSKSSQVKSGAPAKSPADASTATSTSTSMKKTFDSVVSEKDIVFNYLDYYPAEMMLWRHLEPYNIEANFRCHLTFENPHLKPYLETLYLKAICKVVPPDFIHNLNLQEVDFERTIVGMSCTKIIRIQNTLRVNISPKVSSVSPIGGFFVPELYKVELPPEYYLHIPVTFKPFIPGKQMELFEITSNETKCSFVLKGEGVPAHVRFNPKYRVLRMLTSVSELDSCEIEVQNESSAPIRVTFQKVCELMGDFVGFKDSLQSFHSAGGAKTKQSKPDKSGGKQSTTTHTKQEKQKQQQKEQKQQEDPRSSTVIRPKYSNDLMADEEYAIEYGGNFELRHRESVEQDEEMPFMFSIDGDTNDCFMDVAERSKGTCQIMFGFQQDMALRKKRKLPQSSGDKERRVHGKMFVAKYNAILGSATLLKDFIVLGAFKYTPPARRSVRHSRRSEAIVPNL